MPIRYACFISYQRGNDVVDRFARELFQRLSDELGLLTSLPVWFDTARLKAGEDFGSATVEALASSVCLVPVLTPTYFSIERPYCTQEFLGMRQIQQARWRVTGRKDQLIVPVVLRGGNRLPSPIVQDLKPFNFSDYLAYGPKQFLSKSFASSVAQLSERIAHLCDTYEGIGELRELDVSRFTLPSLDETRVWLNSLDPSPRTPAP